MTGSTGKKGIKYCCFLGKGKKKQRANYYISWIFCLCTGCCTSATWMSWTGPPCCTWWAPVRSWRTSSSRIAPLAPLSSGRMSSFFLEVELKVNLLNYDFFRQPYLGALSCFNAVYHKVPQCLFPRRNLNPPLLLPQASVYSVHPHPKPKGGGEHTRLRVRGRPNSDDWRKSLPLCLFYVAYTVYFSSKHNITGLLTKSFLQKLIRSVEKVSSNSQEYRF